MAGIDFLAIQIRCADAIRDIMIAELSELQYDSMMETQEGLEAYIEKALFKEDQLKQLITKYSEQPIAYEVQPVIARNWNEEWEKNYDPIVVEDQIYVRATFHDPQTSFPYEIVINPRMSFGTGHHSTTYLMLKNQLDLDHNKKRVLDAGTGTGILAVMAEKLGASEVIAYDNNSWSIENAPENLKLNHCKKVRIREGTIDTLNLSGNFNIVLANINKNVLLEEMTSYCSCLAINGFMVLSGFYEDDTDDIVTSAVQCGLVEKKRIARNDWCSVVFTKMN
ncbi:MAG: 50S ribosomal protein L11 methyltransferase [Bacteroidota bacterium]